MSHGSAGFDDAGPTNPLSPALPPVASLLVVDEKRDQSVLELLVLLELDFGGGGGGDGDGGSGGKGDGGGGGIGASCGISGCGCSCGCSCAGSDAGCGVAAASVGMAPVQGVMVRSRRYTTPGGAGAGLPLLVRTMIRRFIGRHGTRLGAPLPASAAGCTAVAADQYSLEPTNHWMEPGVQTTV